MIVKATIPFERGNVVRFYKDVRIVRNSDFPNWVDVVKMDAYINADVVAPVHILAMIPAGSIIEIETE